MKRVIAAGRIRNGVVTMRVAAGVPATRVTR